MTKNKDVYRVQKGENYSLYTKNGEKHNLNGPALTIGKDEWYYVNGEKYTWSEWTDHSSLYEVYGADPLFEKEQFAKAEDSPDGIYVAIK